MGTNNKIASTTLDHRFWSKVNKDGPNGCWLWTNWCDNYGYGKFLFKRKYRRAYHLLFTELNGPLPENRELDHLCKNKSCVNPAHLEVVTHKENMLRSDTPAAKAARSTHCKHGHPRTPENCWRNTRFPTWRKCKICANDTRRLRYRADR